MVVFARFDNGDISLFLSALEKLLEGWRATKLRGDCDTSCSASDDEDLVVAAGRGSGVGAGQGSRAGQGSTREGRAEERGDGRHDRMTGQAETWKDLLYCKRSYKETELRGKKKGDPAADT